MVGSVIQATGNADFEDSSSIGIKSEIRNQLQTACTIPKVNLAEQKSLEADSLPICCHPWNQWYQDSCVSHIWTWEKIPLRVHTFEGVHLNKQTGRLNMVIVNNSKDSGSYCQQGKMEMNIRFHIQCKDLFA